MKRKCQIIVIGCCALLLCCQTYRYTVYENTYSDEKMQSTPTPIILDTLLPYKKSAGALKYQNSLLMNNNFQQAILHMKIFLKIWPTHKLNTIIRKRVVLLSLFRYHVDDIQDVEDLYRNNAFLFETLDLLYEHRKFLVEPEWILLEKMIRSGSYNFEAMNHAISLLRRNAGFSSPSDGGIMTCELFDEEYMDWFFCFFEGLCTWSTQNFFRK